MNKIFLIGNLTRDPELSQTPSGITMCRFSLAVSRRFANADGERETDFFNVVAWRGLAENCGRFLKKGNKACVVGSLQIRSFDGQDGQRRTSVEVSADDVEFLTPKNAGGDSGSYDDFRSEPKAQPRKAKSIADLEPVEDDGDLPF